MRTDSNNIAIRAIRNLLGGAKPLQLDIGETKVTCSVTPMPPRPWPGDKGGVVEAEDGPWPGSVAVDSSWSGGTCRLMVEIFRWTSSGRYLDDLALRVRTDQNREVIFVNVSNELEDAADDRPDRLTVRFYITRGGFDDETLEALNDGMSDTLAESQIPILGMNKAELCSVEIPSGILSAEHAFRRLIELALLKLDFIDSPRTAQRGTPLVDITRWLTPQQIAELNGVDRPDEQEEVPPTVGGERRYWAGGIAKKERLAAFKAGNFWQIGWSRASDKQGAKKTWKLFASIQPGDYFVIKSLGGTNDLALHLIGEVTGIDPAEGKLDLSPLARPLYKGKGFTGPNAGNWHDTLVPIKRADIIKSIFGAEVTGAPPAPPPPNGGPPRALDVPLNLILYGPPGTGKTHHITNKLIDRFRRVPSKTDSFADIVADRTWFEVIAIALADLRKTTVPRLEVHPLIKAKHAVNPVKHLSARLWATLQMHTVESSKTVSYAKRAPDQYFDKTADSEWLIAEELPEEITSIAKQLHRPPPAAMLDDFTFVTFHQAYSYEDFIEGIRPSTDSEGALSYDLEAGVFMRAAQKALSLAGYSGSLHDFCGLLPEQRAAQFDGARPYAIFIDEINRGNVARIFGELITLIEDDKRLGEENEVIVHLPYSKKRFGVPPNLHVIGTMNTADRSIDALDTALRRRFEFKELPPQPTELEFEIEGGIAADKMLIAINQRLERLYDRDHCIGHAYFLKLRDKPTLDGLKTIFRNKLVPLLQEYFFGDWGKIGLVLGKDFVRERKAAGKPFAEFAHDDHDALAERPCWEVTDIDKLSNVAFQRIYKDVPEAT